MGDSTEKRRFEVSRDNINMGEFLNRQGITMANWKQNLFKANVISSIKTWQKTHWVSYLDMFLHIGAPTNWQNPWKVPVNEFILMKIPFLTFCSICKKTNFFCRIKGILISSCISWILRILEEQISKRPFQWLHNCKQTYLQPYSEPWKASKIEPLREYENSHLKMFL